MGCRLDEVQKAARNPAARNLVDHHSGSGFFEHDQMQRKAIDQDTKWKNRKIVCN